MLRQAYGEARPLVGVERLDAHDHAREVRFDADCDESMSPAELSALNVATGSGALEPDDPCEQCESIHYKSIARRVVAISKRGAVNTHMLNACKRLCK